MAEKIATTVAVTGPDDNLAAVDPHGSTPTDVISQIKAELDPLADAAMNSAKNSLFNPNNIVNSIDVTDGKVKLNGSMKDVFMDDFTKSIGMGQRTNKAAGTNLEGIPGVGMEVTELARQFLPYVSDYDASYIFNTAEDIFKIADGTDTQSAAGLMGAIGKFAGIDAFQSTIDEHAWLATGLSYLDKAIELGIPDAIDKLMGKFKDKKLQRKLLIKNVRSVILRSDLSTLNKIMDWIGADAVNEKVPDAAHVLLAVYRYPPRTKPEDYDKLRKELLDTLNRLDPNWDTTTRKGKRISNLAPFTSISGNAKTLLSFVEKYRTPILIARRYPMQTLLQLSRRQYPKMVVWENADF